MRRYRGKRCWIRGGLLGGLMVCLGTLPWGGPASANAVRGAQDDPLAAVARPLRTAGDLDPLLEAVGDRRLVLLGEASHGTREFYAWRATISRRLILERGFSFIAVEGDWEACMQVNRYVKDLPGAAADGREALAAFTRWPQWMWANEETLELVEWLREHNRARPPGERVGVYGFDIYGVAASVQKAPRYLERLDPETAVRMRAALASFGPYAGDPQSYAQRLQRGEPDSARALREIWDELLANRARYTARDAEAFLHAKQHAAVIVSAEAHYRKMLQPGPGSWNARARHFLDTVTRLQRHYGGHAGAIAWAHNTHVGDVQATVAQPGMVTMGRHARERYGHDGVWIVGFGTHRGEVKAARSWGGARERMVVPRAMPDSLEDRLHRLGLPAAWFLTGDAQGIESLRRPLGHRAIGVIYHPEREAGNYVPTFWLRRYDAFVYLDETHALSPLDES